MQLKPAIYTLITVVAFIVLSVIQVAGKPLIAWLIFLLIGFLCVTLILSEIYDFFTGDSGAWLDIDL